MCYPVLSHVIPAAPRSWAGHSQLPPDASSCSAFPLNPAFLASYKSNYFLLLMFVSVLEIIMDLMII